MREITGRQPNSGEPLTGAAPSRVARKTLAKLGRRIARSKMSLRRHTAIRGVFSGDPGPGPTRSVGREAVDPVHVLSAAYPPRARSACLARLPLPERRPDSIQGRPARWRRVLIAAPVTAADSPPRVHAHERIDGAAAPASCDGHPLAWGSGIRGGGTSGPAGDVSEGLLDRARVRSGSG